MYIIAPLQRCISLSNTYDKELPCEDSYIKQFSGQAVQKGSNLGSIFFFNMGKGQELFIVTESSRCKV